MIPIGISGAEMSDLSKWARALSMILPSNLVGYVLPSDFTILLLGDHHYRTNNAPETDAFEKRTHQLITLYRPTAVVNLGDTLDTHERINVRPLVRAKSFIQSIADRVPIYVLIGNHDRPNNSDFQSNLHPFGALASYPGVHIIEKSQYHFIGGRRFLFVPYVPPGRMAEAMITAMPLGEHKGERTVEDALTGVTAVFAHQEFLGAHMGAIRSTVGDPWLKHWPPCYSGHVHDYHELQPNLIYVGAPLEHAFGAAKTQGVSLLAGSEHGLAHSRIPLVIRKRVTVPATSHTLEEVKLPQQERDLLPPMVRVVIRGTETELKGLGTHPLVRQWRQGGVKVDFKAVKVEAKAAPMQELAPEVTFTDALLGRLSKEQGQLLLSLLQ